MNPEHFYRYKLSSVELLVLQAIACSSVDGDFSLMSLGQIAAHTKLSRRTVQACLHGKPQDGKGPARPGLIQRGVLIPVVPHSASERRPTIYRINLDVLDIDPRVKQYLQDLDSLEFRSEINAASQALSSRNFNTEN